MKLETSETVSDTREHANALEELWRDSERRYNARRRRWLQAEWFGYYSGLAHSLRLQAAEFEHRAEALCIEETEGPYEGRTEK